MVVSGSVNVEGVWFLPDGVIEAMFDLLGQREASELARFP